MKQRRSSPYKGMKCRFTGCDRAAKARGLCFYHYNRQHSSGTLDTSFLKVRTAEERFWQHVQKTETCWIWLATTDRQGYGQFHPEPGMNRIAHKWLYQRMVGPIPEGMQLDHLCRNTSCVNPAHLEVVTARENTMRGNSRSAINARKTECNRGHPFTPKNTRRDRYGQRNCRKCDYIRLVMYRQKRRESSRNPS